MKSNNRIILENISKTYNNEKVLDIKHCTIPLYGFVAIIGWSGTGKSTLLNIISLLDYPDLSDKEEDTPSIIFEINNTSYSIEFFEYTKPSIKKTVNNNSQKLSENQFRKELFGYIFQMHCLHPNFTLERNITMPLIIQKKSIVFSKLSNISSIIGINNHLHNYTGEVSGGQAQRASIMRALIKNSPIILGDELTNNIDYKFSKIILEEFKKGVQNKNYLFQVFIWVSHDIHLIKKYADTIITIKNSNIICSENNFNNYNEIIEHLKEDYSLQNKNISTTHFNKVIKFCKQASNIFENTDLNIEETKTTEPIPNKKNNSDFFDLDFEKTTRIAQLKFFFLYAFCDLFRRRSLKNFFKIFFPNKKLWLPTTDCTVFLLSLSCLLLLLFSILKISYGSQKFLELKLSDPRINCMEIIKKGGTLTEKDLNYLKKIIGDKLRYITPVYNVNTSIKNIKRKKYNSIGNAITFRKDDPIILEILNDNKAPFVTDENSFQGIIISEKTLNDFGYKNSENTVNVTFNRFNLNGDIELPVIKVNDPLPFDRIAVMREEFYLKYYKKSNNEINPYFPSIIVYPKTVYLINEIIKIVEMEASYKLHDIFEVKNKVITLNEINKLAINFSLLSILAISLFSVFVICATIYNSINKKRKEIGVFLAYGMHKTSFYAFYLIEALIVGLLTIVLSGLSYFLFIKPSINSIILNGGFLELIKLSGNNNAIIETTLINLPITLIIIIYSIVCLILFFLFIFIIQTFFIRKKPVDLMRD